jgi:hypothetical protein
MVHKYLTNTKNEEESRKQTGLMYFSDALVPLGTSTDGDDSTWEEKETLQRLEHPFKTLFHQMNQFQSIYVRIRIQYHPNTNTLALHHVQKETLWFTSLRLNTSDDPTLIRKETMGIALFFFHLCHQLMEFATNVNKEIQIVIHYPNRRFLDILMKFLAIPSLQNNTREVTISFAMVKKVATLKNIQQRFLQLYFPVKMRFDPSILSKRPRPTTTFLRRLPDSEEQPLPSSRRRTRPNNSKRNLFSKRRRVVAPK